MGLSQFSIFPSFDLALQIHDRKTWKTPSPKKLQSFGETGWFNFELPSTTPIAVRQKLHNIMKADCASKISPLSARVIHHIQTCISTMETMHEARLPSC